MTPNDFIVKWKNGGDERRDFQSFFDDLCRMLGHPTPREADPDHTWFTYEYGASKTSGGEGWADAWKKGYFGFEAKGTGKDLAKAYQQLKMYADALENPPLLIVSDLQRFEIHTNFTATIKKVYAFRVEDLADPPTRKLLSLAFNDPAQLRPGITRTAITEEAAEKFATLAEALRKRGHDPHAVAHFLNRLLFCMFAEDIGLLPEHIFAKLVSSSQGQPEKFESRAAELFAAMKDGGDFALNAIEWFNGGLFEDASTLRLEASELATLQEAARLDWSEIDPSIFGTLFERGLDPNKRSQLGAHYTDPATIMKIVGPVIVEPWLAEWEVEKAAIAKMLAKSNTRGIPKPAQNRFNSFLERLRDFRVLDPACGSGNFLFVALRSLKDLEQRVMFEAEELGLPRQVPAVGPANVLGIELNEYAAELARITVWIGEIQWMIQNGHGARRDPILQALGGIENRDALINPDGTEANWPAADVIVGNPPFIGGNVMLGELGASYVDALRRKYEGRVPGGADFVCYWFAKANDAIKVKQTLRAGLVATQSIRNGTSRRVLERIVDSSRIFNAWSDQQWVNEGAAVRVSLVCFGKSEGSVLDNAKVTEISADLTAGGESGFDAIRVKRLEENRECAFQGTKKVGEFDVRIGTALEWAMLPNPNGESNLLVLKPSWNGLDVTRRPRETWIVDFGTKLSETDASFYEAPFAHVLDKVKPERVKNRRESRAKYWWRHGDAQPSMRAAIAGLPRYIVTPEVAKHRVFAWANEKVSPDCKLMVIARSDDTAFGVLQSRIHEVWALRMGSVHGDGKEGGRPRYTPSTTFETFPFPAGLTPNIPGSDYADNPHAQAIARAAHTLVEARDTWLNPPEWVEWTRTAAEVVAGFPLRPVAKLGYEAALRKRMLTNLYNSRPAWLANLHSSLDKAVASAYGWEWPMTDDEILARLFELNRARAAAYASSTK